MAVVIQETSEPTDTQKSILDFFENEKIPATPPSSVTPKAGPTAVEIERIFGTVRVYLDPPWVMPCFVNVNYLKTLPYELISKVIFKSTTLTNFALA